MFRGPLCRKRHRLANPGQMNIASSEFMRSLIGKSCLHSFGFSFAWQAFGITRLPSFLFLVDVVLDTLLIVLERTIEPLRVGDSCRSRCGLLLHHPK